MVVGFLAGVAAFSSRSTLIRPVLIAGAVLAFGAWIPLLGLVALNAALGTEYSGNALGLVCSASSGSMLGGVVSAVGLVMRSWEWVTSIQGGEALSAPAATLPSGEAALWRRSVQGRWVGAINLAPRKLLLSTSAGSVASCHYNGNGLMTFETWLAFAAASAILVLIPGPTVLLVVSYALGQGWRTALPMAVGVALGDFTAMALSMLGVGRCSPPRRRCSRR